MSRATSVLALLVAVACWLAVGSQQASVAGTAPICDSWASTSAPAGGNGTRTSPFASAQRLVDSLRPGTTGCLLGGVYEEDITFEQGGLPRRPVTLRGAPGVVAVLRGTFWISRTAADVTVSDLHLDGSPNPRSPSPQINGDRSTFDRVQVTNRHTGICFILGGAFERAGIAHGTVIKRSWIHDCGALPRTTHDHGIYVEGSVGAQIFDNVIQNNADWGVHLYPNAHRTLVTHNVLIGNGGGVIIAGAHAVSGGEYTRDYASSDNTIRKNIVVDSVAGFNVETYWGGPTGTDNIVTQNCFWNARRGNVGPRDGMDLTANVSAPPSFVAPGKGDYHVRRGSRCHAIGAGLR